MNSISHHRWTARRSHAAVGLALMTLASGGSTPAVAQTIPSDAQATCTVPGPTFLGWFQPASVVNGQVVVNGIANPANSVTFPNSPNCSFYQWSYQMFLWLTSPAPPTYGGGDRIFDSPVFYDVSPPDATGNRTFIPHTPGLIRFLGVREAQLGPDRLPIVVDKTGRMFEIEAPQAAPSGKPIVLNRSGNAVEIESAAVENGKAVFRDKAGKPIAGAKPAFRPRLSITRPSQLQIGNAAILQRFNIGGIPVFVNSAGAVVEVEQGQAGGGQVLEAQNGSLIYYAIMVNDVYAYFLTGAKNGGITPMPTQFPTTQTQLNQITTFASAHGKTFPDPEALAVELKTSWIEAAGLPNLNNYITMMATVPTYDKSNPNQWVPNGQKTVQLALVGMHVVGSTAGHPEMIWATFEHFGATPNATYTYNSTSGPNPKTVSQTTAGTWLFSATNSSGPFNVPHMRLSGTSIVPLSPNSISPSDTLRIKPWGGASNASPNPLDPTVAASNTEIISIDHSVSTQMPAGDVRNNYFMTGATWTIGGAAPSGNFGNPGNPSGNAVGTSQLNNTTMETYQQGTPPFNSFGANCFLCHGTNTTSVSHIYGGLQPLSP
jgi:hypothetical protein